MSQIAALPSNSFTLEQLKLITDTIAKGATPDELKLFLYRCQTLGLDPLKPGQIYFIKYGNSAGTIVIGIEGFRARAQATGKLSGIKRGALRGDKGELVGAFAEVYRSDWKECAREEVPLSEYNTGKGNWAKMPETMIKKVAEAAALRMAFPDDLGGVYTKEEMDQADSTPRVFADQPGSNDGVQPPATRNHITSGSFAGKKTHELDHEEKLTKQRIIETKPRASIEELQNLDSINELLTTAAQVDPEAFSFEDAPAGPLKKEKDIDTSRFVIQPKSLEPKVFENTVPLSPHPTCCGIELAFSPKTNKYYCPNWKDKGAKHIAPIPKAEY